MISHKYKCIFVHIQRTAGNSIELVLEGISLLDKDFKATELWDNSLHRGVPGPYKIDNRGHWMHSSAEEIKKKCNPEEFNDYFKFSFVRNPWGRMASWYRLRCYNLKMKIGHTGVSCAARKTHWHGDFATWLTHPDLNSQTSMLYDNQGQCLVDFIGRFESLQQDFNFICDEIKTPHKQLPHLNATESDEPYYEHYNDETRDIVGSRYSEDIENFGYQF